MLGLLVKQVLEQPKAKVLTKRDLVCPVCKVRQRVRSPVTGRINTKCEECKGIPIRRSNDED